MNVDWNKAAAWVQEEMRILSHSIAKKRVPPQPQRTARLERELQHCYRMAAIRPKRKH